MSYVSTRKQAKKRLNTLLVIGAISLVGYTALDGDDQDKSKDHIDENNLEKIVQDDKKLPSIVKRVLDEGLMNYNIALMEKDSTFPITLDALTYRMAQGFTDIKNSEQRARKIFDWQIGRINYGDSKREKCTGYRTAMETLKAGEGVCGESAYLYVALARAAGLQAATVGVTQDYKGKRVNHGCAVVRIGSREILVDPAYRMFDVFHKKYRIQSDEEATEKFKKWRVVDNVQCRRRGSSVVMRPTQQNNVRKKVYGHLEKRRYAGKTRKTRSQSKYKRVPVRIINEMGR